MTYKTPCPHCGQRIEADIQWCGRTVTCPACNRQFVMPDHRAPSAPPVSWQPTQTKDNTLAAVSLALAVLSLPLCLLAIPAIICGHIARRRVRVHGANDGGLALAGLIVAYTAIATTVVAVTVYLAAVHASTAGIEQARERARRISCNGRLNQLGRALRIYSSDYNGHFPPYDGARGLRILLVNEYLPSPDLLVCPNTGTRPARDAWSLREENVDFEYEGGHTEAERPDTPIAWERATNHKDFGNILYIEGNVKGYAGADWRKHLSPRRAPNR